MFVPVKSILGVAGIPTHRTSATNWLIKAGVPIVTLEGDARRPEAVKLSDLPAEVRRALLERDIEASGLPMGTCDDEAHADMMNATPAMRAAAEAKAAIARDFLAIGSRMSWAQKIAFIREKHGEDGTSEASLARIVRAVKGVDPINFAPALLSDIARVGRPKVEMSDAAWSYFMTAIRDGGEGFPLKSAWRDVRDLKQIYGWQWPDYQAVLRRWKALPEAQKLHARLGHSEAVKRLAMPALRDKTTIGPLEWVSLDGRTKDFWAHNGDGKARRYTFLALVDCATNFILGWTLAESENARATQALIKRVCQTWGIFDRLYPDNGSAFAGHQVAGGAVKRFRNSGAKLDGVKPLGICHHLGIAIHFALPRNGQAKTAERTFATLSRVLDDRPEFKGAHAGHKSGAAPDSRVVPVPLETALAVCTREVARHNAESGRRGQGMLGRSYQAAFEAGLAKRIKRTPTARQLYLSGLIYTPIKVTRWGQVELDGWTYGAPDTQNDLLPYHKRSEAVLLGRDPDNFEAPALAWNAKNELICEGIQPVKRGAYGSVDGVRQAATNRKAAREAVSAAAAANTYLTDADMRAAYAAIPTPGGPTPAPAAVVAGQFSGKLKTQKRGNTAPAVDDDEVNLVAQFAKGRRFLTEEHLQNLDKDSARKLGLA